MRYARPEPGHELTVAPALESWDRSGSASQLRLAAFLDSVQDQMEAAPDDVPLVLHLDVGVAAHQSLTSGGRDLDNYLFPLMRRFGHGRFVGVSGRKIHGPSRLAIGPARLAPGVETDPRPQLTCRTTASGQSRQWKVQVASACREAAPTPPLDGALRLQVHYRLSARRNWSAQWKPTIDALGAVLGTPNPARPFQVNDDRITSLDLTREQDESLGWDIVVMIRWDPAG